MPRRLDQRIRGLVRAGTGPSPSGGLVRASQVIIVGTGGELLVYNPAQVNGDLIASIDGQAGVDTPLNNAILQGVASYQAPGLGQAAALQSGTLALFQGPTSGAGPWVQHFTLLSAGSQIQMNGAQNGDAISILSGPPAGGGTAGGAGTSIDGKMYGGQRAFYAAGQSTAYTNNVLTVDPILQVTGLAPSGIYRFRCHVLVNGANSNTSGGLTWSIATDGTGRVSLQFNGTTGLFNKGDSIPASGHSAATAGTGAGSEIWVMMDGLLYTASTVLTGTYLDLERFG